MKFLIFIFLAPIGLASAAQEKIIYYSEKPKGWVIQTNSSCYQLLIDANGSLRSGFYGSKTQANNQGRNASFTGQIEEVPVRGGTASKTPALEVIFADHVRDIELLYVSGEVVSIDGRQTLKIILKDPVYPLQVTSYIRVLPEYDILEKWIEVKNTGSKDAIKIENLKSGNIVLPPDEYILTQLSGKELNEFQPFESLLVPGVRTIQNKAFKANANAPWFQVRPANSNKDEKGPTWFGAIHYSGNWDFTFDKAFNSTLQILGGINFWDTDLNLKTGSEFTTPKVTFGYAEDGNDGVSLRLQSYVRNEILPAAFRTKERPILYNSWYATTYNLKEDEQVALAEIAARTGVEYFVFDDGWFKGRTASDSGLGDWEVDKTKFPNGLGSVIKRINGLGMKFGIWVEPESVNLKTDVYLYHPDWVLQFPGRRKNCHIGYS